jgi:hypothetical protein
MGVYAFPKFLLWASWLGLHLLIFLLPMYANNTSTTVISTQAIRELDPATLLPLCMLARVLRYQSWTWPRMT